MAKLKLEQEQEREILVAVRLTIDGEDRVFEPGDEDELAEALEDDEGIDEQAEYARLEKQKALRGFSGREEDEDDDEQHPDPDLRANARGRRASAVVTKRVKKVAGPAKRRRAAPPPTTTDAGEGEE